MVTFQANANLTQAKFSAQFNPPRTLGKTTPRHNTVNANTDTFHPQQQTAQPQFGMRRPVATAAASVAAGLAMLLAGCSLPGGENSQPTGETAATNTAPSPETTALLNTAPARLSELASSNFTDVRLADDPTISPNVKYYYFKTQERPDLEGTLNIVRSDDGRLEWVELSQGRGNKAEGITFYYGPGTDGSTETATLCRALPAGTASSYASYGVPLGQVNPDLEPSAALPVSECTPLIEQIMAAVEAAAQ